MATCISTPITKGYFFLNLTTHKIGVSRNIVFHEHDFPYKNIYKSHNSLSLFVPHHYNHNYDDMFHDLDINTSPLLNNSSNTTDVTPTKHATSSTTPHIDKSNNETSSAPVTLPSNTKTPNYINTYLIVVMTVWQNLPYNFVLTHK